MSLKVSDKASATNLSKNQAGSGSPDTHKA